MKNTNIEFEFKCFNCEIIFPVYFGYLKDKANLSCPNCSQIFPEDVLKNLKSSIANLEAAVKSLKSSNQYKYGWNFHINWNKLLSLPERPGEYDHLGITIIGNDKDPFNLS